MKGRRQEVLSGRAGGWKPPVAGSQPRGRPPVPRATVKAIEQLYDESLGGDEKPLSRNEISYRTGVPRSTVHDIIRRHEAVRIKGLKLSE
jgi:DNA invertase Pin-like site-specific DNA recombinase